MCRATYSSNNLRLACCSPHFIGVTAELGLEPRLPALSLDHSPAQRRLHFHLNPNPSQIVLECRGQRPPHKP